MHKKRYIKRAALVLLGVVMALSAGSVGYAFEGGDYHDFRDGKISIYLPEGWTSEEIDAEEAEDRGYEQMFETQDEGGKSGLNLDVYFMTDKAQTDDYIYFGDDETEAQEYYENYGNAALDNLYFQLPEAGRDALMSTWEAETPEFFKGQWNGFLVTEMKGHFENDPLPPVEYEHTIYITAKMTDDSQTVVHNILVFHNDDNSALTEQQEKLAEEIADEFYDYGYGNVMAGVKPENSLWSDEWDMSGGDEMNTVMTILIGIVSILAPLGIIVGVIVIIAKRAAERDGSSRSGGKNGSHSFSANFGGIGKSLDLGDAISKFKKRRTEKTSFSGQEQRMEKRTLRKENRVERRTERKPLQAAERRSTMQMRRREAESAEQRYYNSLQTLLKSGLLTREEMRDMLQRHERSRVRQRRH